MRRMLIVMAGLASVATAGPEAGSADSLGWLSGRWEQAEGERWAEELWSAPRGGMLIGFARMGRGDTLGSFEHMRIAPGEGGTLHFYGSPQGAPAVAFRLVRSGPAEAVFENPAHDFPQRVRYWRDGEVLRAEVSDLAGGKAMAWAYRPR